jgi:glycine cleavage system H lipoate-binding protein
MFPWVDGFHWSVGHVVFLSLFFGVVLTILTTLIAAIWRTASDFRTHRATETCWRANFAELPDAERRCRHELAGRVPKRICQNAFDCCHCPKYAEFVALPIKTPSRTVGISYSDKLLYHRGHTWVRQENDGTLTVGLDDLAAHLIGHPDSVEFPQMCSEIESNGIAWRMTKNGYEIRVRAPIDGTVVGTGNSEAGWYLRVLPHGQANLRHLLRGTEVRGWLSGELDRLQLQLSGPNATPCLADGGTLMPELMDAMPEADWDTVLAATFLET